MEDFLYFITENLFPFCVKLVNRKQLFFKNIGTSSNPIETQTEHFFKFEKLTLAAFFSKPIYFSTFQLNSY